MAYVEQGRGGPLPFCRRTGKLWELQCEGGHGGLKYIPCAKLDCDTCKEVVKRRRGRRLFGRIGGGSVGFWVFTVPRFWHQHLGQGAMREMRRAALQASLEVDARLYGLATGAHAYVHPCGDVDPATWTPHVHVQTPRMGLRPDGALVELPAMMPAEALDLARGVWFRVLTDLARLLNSQGAGLLLPVHWQEVNVHYRFTRRDTPGQTFHHLAYDGRPFPTWSAGTLEPWLARGASAGLLAPRSSHPGVEQWREAVAGDPAALDELERTGQDRDEQVRAGRVCHCCDARPEVVAVHDRGHKVPRLPLVDLAGLELSHREVDAIEEHLLGLEEGLSAIPPPLPVPLDDIPF